MGGLEGTSAPLPANPFEDRTQYLPGLASAARAVGLARAGGSCWLQWLDPTHRTELKPESFSVHTHVHVSELPALCLSWRLGSFSICPAPSPLPSPSAGQGSCGRASAWSQQAARAADIHLHLPWQPGTRAAPAPHTCARGASPFASFRSVCGEQGRAAGVPPAARELCGSVQCHRKCLCV